MDGRRNSPGGGSSPHARGTHALGRVVLRLGRFIPACAGNTSKRIRVPRIRTVHPRMRGEHSFTRRAWRWMLGSSPHARGTLTTVPLFQQQRRFIPACAGNTPAAMSPMRRDSVHPRMRGEHRSLVNTRSPGRGSSPHARGTRRRGQSRGREARFIPACAGNTTRAAWCSFSAAVHPRMRGEHFITSSGSRPVDGSSPHARGTHQIAALQSTTQRFIPACAGNT
ncbi:Domain of uncharacterised function (DUF2825) [Bordetella ansorpii]|uniref:Domain of uncharacterized function (DUF2825) n=1 Tax=Bordetella ansorpii TaxID=288768 RepID=A0A157QTD8_9BORD|nr:Domain of uncharacterised function (DUF2825) [Bordetella ansorpii]